MASVDPIEENKGFAEQEKADFPLLSDPTKATATAYGVLNPGGLARRWTFYIGKDGKILGIDKAVKPKSSAEDMVAKLGEYRRRAGEVVRRRSPAASFGAASPLIRYGVAAWMHRLVAP